MQEGDVGASISDLQIDKADDDGPHMPERCIERMATCFQQKTFKQICQKMGLPVKQMFETLRNSDQISTVLTNDPYFVLVYYCALVSFYFEGVFCCSCWICFMEWRSIT